MSATKPAKPAPSRAAPAGPKSLEGSKDAKRNASIRTPADHRAALHGRPGRWTCDDVEAARAYANETARPWGANGPTPAERWRARAHLTSELRQRVRESCRIVQDTERRLRGMLAGVVIDPYYQRSIDRAAISRALVEHQILEYRRG